MSRKLTSPLPGEIKVFRAFLGLSQVAFAEKLGVSRRTVESWESGANVAPPLLRWAMAAVNHGLEPWIATGSIQVTKDGDGWRLRAMPHSDNEWTGEPIFERAFATEAEAKRALSDAVFRRLQIP